MPRCPRSKRLPTGFCTCSSKAVPSRWMTLPSAEAHTPEQGARHEIGIEPSFGSGQASLCPASSTSVVLAIAFQPASIHSRHAPPCHHLIVSRYSPFFSATVGACGEQHESLSVLVDYGSCAAVVKLLAFCEELARLLLSRWRNRMGMPFLLLPDGLKIIAVSMTRQARICLGRGSHQELAS